jgi:hypothetical protein
VILAPFDRLAQQRAAVNQRLVTPEPLPLLRGLPEPTMHLQAGAILLHPAA